MPAPVPPDEGVRLEALRRYGVLDTPPEAEFDDLAILAGAICRTPIALITLIDEHRQFHKAAIGLDPRVVPREAAFCAHTILSDAPFIVEHAPSDPRFTDNPQVTGPPHIRFYAGAPLISPDGLRLGSLCVVDRERRQLSDEQVGALQTLARAVVTQLELRRAAQGLGQRTMIWGATLDVTGQRESADAVRESEGRYRLMFEGSPQPMWVFDDDTLAFLAVNNAALEQYGYTRDEFLHLTLRDIRPPEDVARLEAYRRERPGAQLRAGHWRHQRKDGSLIDVEVTSHPIEWDARRARLALATDITERLAAERAVRASREQLSLVLESAGLGFWDWDIPRSRFVVSERFAAMLGYRLEELSLPPLDWGELVHAEDLGGATDLWTRHLEAGATPLDLELRARAKTGEWRWVQVRGRIVERDTAGNPSRALGTLLDIGERKTLEAHFLRAQRMESIGTLAGGIAHDLNNVLTPILMGADLLRTLVTDPLALGTVAMIDESATRGADMVRQVLSFARGYEGSRSEVDPWQPLEDVARIARETFPRNISVETSCNGPLSTVAADPTQLHQVLLNLCLNARDAMPAGGQLRLHAESAVVDESYAGMSADAHPGRYVIISVTDTGTGIPPAIKDRIFDPFFTTKEPGSGTGLGLSTASAIVRSHGGFMTVYSERDRGATFRIYLPAADGSAVDPAATPQAAMRRGHDELVLVVDDEAPIRLVCRRTLEAFGYRVIAASDGAEGVAVYAEHRNDVRLVLLDMMMPIMDGPSTARAMLRMNKHVRIVGASGLADSALASRALAAGVRQLIAKPYTAEMLLETIARVLDEDER